MPSKVISQKEITLLVWRNTSCRVSWRWSSVWWEPKARVHKLLTVCTAKDAGTRGSGWVTGHSETQQNLMAQEEGWNFHKLRLWWDKSPGILVFGIPPWRHQLELSLCSCAMNELLSGMRHLRLCYGKPRVELVRTPGDLYEGGCIWSQVGSHVKGLWSQQWKAPVVGVWLPEWLLGGPSYCGMTSRGIWGTVSGEISN